MDRNYLRKNTIITTIINLIITCVIAYIFVLCVVALFSLSGLLGDESKIISDASGKDTVGGFLIVGGLFAGLATALAMGIFGTFALISGIFLFLNITFNIYSFKLLSLLKSQNDDYFIYFKTKKDVSHKSFFFIVILVLALALIDGAIIASVIFGIPAIIGIIFNHNVSKYLRIWIFEHPMPQNINPRFMNSPFVRNYSSNPYFNNMYNQNNQNVYNQNAYNANNMNYNQTYNNQPNDYYNNNYYNQTNNYTNQETSYNNQNQQ